MTAAPEDAQSDCCAGSPSSDNRFDLAILGGGSAAFAAASRASALGARTLMVNDGPIGGTCVNIGCVPSKTMVRAAENHHLNGLARFRGLHPRPGQVDFPELIREKDELVASLRQAKYADVLAGLPNVVLVEGRGRLIAAGVITVGTATYRADRVIVATGSRPALPCIHGLAESGVWDSTSALAADALPERLIVLGGRYVALELGQTFARLGSEVTVVQRSERLLPDDDADVSAAITGYLRAEGLTVRTGTTVGAVARRDDGFSVRIRHGDREELLAADAVLAALGRTANTEGLGLDKVGLRLSSDGSVEVDETLRTSLPGVYGAGDVIGQPAFVYAAAYEGGLAAENALTGSATPRDYTAIPWVIFTDPQVAGVGLDERQAAAAGIAVDVSVLPLDQVPRALAARDTRGFVKLLRARGEDRLVGARVVAPEGGELIMEASLAIKFGLPVSEIARHFHPYLTQSEAIKLAAIGLDRDVKTLSCCAH